jgi:hypothetical protein
MVKKSVETKFKFMTIISQMSKDKHTIWIPKRYHLGIVKSLDKQVRVQKDDEL